MTACMPPRLRGAVPEATAKKARYAQSLNVPTEIHTVR